MVQKEAFGPPVPEEAMAGFGIFVEPEVYQRRRAAAQLVDWGDNHNAREFIEMTIRLDVEHALSADALAGYFYGGKEAVGMRRGRLREKFHKEYHRPAKKILQEQNSSLEILSPRSKKRQYSYYTVDVSEGVGKIEGDGHTLTSHERLFGALMSLEPGTKANSSGKVALRSTIGRLRRDRVGAMRNEEQIETYRRTIGYDGIRLIFGSLEFDSTNDRLHEENVSKFRHLRGDSLVIVKRIIGETTLDTFYKELADPNDQKAVDQLFWSSIEEAVESLWGTKLDITRIENNPLLFSAHEILQKLKENEWTKEEVMALVQKHFGIEVHKGSSLAS